MSNGSRRLSRGDRRRNDRLARLRAAAVLAFDLAADKQVCALTDRDSRVLARRGEGQGVAAEGGGQVGTGPDRGGGVLLGGGRLRRGEPTGHGWRVLDQIAEQAGVRLVFVQPLLVHRARESEDFTHMWLLRRRALA